MEMFTVIENRDKIPTEAERIDCKMKEIETRITEMRKEEETARKRAAKAKKSKETEVKNEIFDKGLRNNRTVLKLHNYTNEG